MSRAPTLGYLRLPQATSGKIEVDAILSLAHRCQNLALYLGLESEGNESYAYWIHLIRLAKLTQ